MEARRWIKEGFLPAPGSIADQSETLLRALMVIDGVVNRIHREEDQKRKKEIERKNRNRGR